MDVSQNPSGAAFAVTTSRRLLLVIKALIAGMLCMAGQVNAQVPDLTTGELPVNADIWINLGPTGVQAWVFRGIEGGPTTDTGLSRQFQVKTIEAGSPADGILAVDDVILGADGTGATPVPFTSDARKSFGDAIGDAEARNPATLKLLVWRAGTTSTMTLTLRHMGAYSPTAPFNCPKSAKILDEGLDYAMANEDAGFAGTSALALMAADNPAYPNNAARQVRAQTYALAQMLSPAQVQYIKDGNIELGAKIAWERGLRLVVLTEYYLKTGDAQVLPSIDAIALSIAHGQGANGAVGHLFNTSIRDGVYNEPFGRGYTMNASTLPTALGLVLARKCGLTLPELDPAIERVTRTLAGTAGVGTFNYYVEGEPYNNDNEDNGKNSLGAIVFAMHNDRVDEARFMANQAVGGAYQREEGHITHIFGLLWGPVGCQVGGQAAAVAHFNEIRWMMDLNRHWDGGFEYERYSSGGSTNSTIGAGSGGNLWMSTAALLTYAMPLKKLEVTGKTFTTRPELVLDNSEIAAAALSNNYDAATRTTAELMQDLLFDLTRTSAQASKELAMRPTDAAAQVPTLIARAADPASPGRANACRALGEIRDDAAVPTLLGLLSDADKDVRFRAAEALAKFPTQLLRENLNTLLQAAIANAKPAYPLAHEDSQQFAQMKLGEVIFGIYGTGGAVNNDLTGIDRALLYPVIRVFAAHPHGLARNRVAAIYNKLTPADVTALSDVLIEGVNYFGVASMTQTPGLEAIKVMERDNWAEGIPLTKDYFINLRFKNITNGITALQNYGTAALTVSPDPQIIDFLNSMLDGEYDSRTDDTYNAQITAIRDALLAASNPPVLPSFKSIQSVMASPAVLTLPAKQTQLNVSFTDLSQGDTVFSWRKVHGPGNVTFSTNDTGGSAAPQVYFEGVPGLYLFEVKAWDSRKLTEVMGTVQVELRNSGGSLPANSPPTASAQSVTVPQAIPTPITLTGTDPESYPLAAFEVVSGPSNGTLGGTPPFLTYTSSFNFTGADSLSFRVRDSNGQWSAPATVSITVATRVDPVGLIVYEPVDYATGNLNGKSGSSEIGFTGSWVAATGTQPVTVVSTSLEYGGLPTAGGSLSNVGFTSRALSPALATSGLLNDGATLWFSVQVGATTYGNLRWALANSSFGGNTITDEGAQPGRGVGFRISSGSPYNATATAAAYMDASTTTDTGDTMFLSESIANMGFVTGNRLLVGKITWGADQDTIQLYLPTTNMVLGPPVSTMETVLDQSSFDTITTTQNSHLIDEIRLGATLESVLLGTVAMPADSAPPSPNAMTFAVAPSMTTPTSATMRAATAFDANFGVEYYFTCTAGGGDDSGWQSSPVYTDTGLTSGVSYSYTVKARDLSPARNEAAPSAAFSVGTPTATVVPALVDLPQAEAEALITGAGLVVGTVTTSSSPTIEAGDVVSQSPSGGISAAVGSAVNLVVSSTVQMDTVPNVVGLTQAAAAASLAAANLTLGTVLTDYSETIAAGEVMNQNPASGTSLPRNSAVGLAVSAGSAAGLAPLTQVFLEGFESPDVNSAVIVNTTVGGSLPNNGQWGASTGLGRGIIDKSSGAFNALDPNHQAFAIRSTDAGIVSAFNKLGTITAGTKYTVAVDIVKDSGQNDGTLANFQLKSFDQTATASTSRDASGEGTVILNQNATAPTSGEFKTVTFEYITASGNPYIGKDLALRITGGTSAANVDNVRVWTSGARLADTAAPWSLAMSPADNASAVGVGSNLTMTLSETVVAGNGYITLKNLTDGSQRLISIADTRQVSFSGSTLTINPERNLTGLSDYGVLIGYGAVRDLAGNPFEGVSDPTAWNFTTGVSSDSTAPTLVSITDDQGGSPVVTGALVNYTLTFSEDMDADTLSAGDFGNAGTSALKFMGVTEVSPGVFTVAVIPTSLGTLQFRINAGATLADASGNALNTNSALADDTIITVNLGILAPVWASAPVVGTNATEDSAYSSTLVTYATDANGNPLTFTKVSGPTWLSVAANGALTGTPINSNVGLNTFVVSMTDGNTAPVQGTLNITVINTNDAPTFTQNPVYTPLATRYAAYASNIAGYAGDIDVGATLAFAKTGGPAWLSVAANGDIYGTPSTGDLGTNSFTVTVSDGIAAPVSATLSITVNAAGPAAPAIYEPFADNDFSLLGNTPGVGLTGTWVSDASVDNPSLGFGALPTQGNRIILPGGVAYAGTGNSLSNLGLLANGSTLWFSFVLDSNDLQAANTQTVFALGSDVVTGPGRSSSGGIKMTNSGSGIGISWTSAFKGIYFNTDITASQSPTSAGNPKIPNLVVASIAWGADDTANETLSIYLPSISLAMPAAPALTFSIPARAQSTFDTISFGNRAAVGSVELIDEIRFGSSYDSVTGQVQITGDGTPPTLAGTSIVDDRSGATVPTGNVVTYTVTFSEDMNAATIGADEFSNAGTSAITIGSIVETSPGVFTVQVTPTTGGTLQLQVAAGALLADMGGNLLDTAAAILDNTTISVNNAPVWSSNPLIGSNATEDAPYTQSLATEASDMDLGSVLTFSKVSGPSWLSIAANGTISGTPANAEVGLNAFTVTVSDGIAAPVETTLQITIINTNDAPSWTSDPIAGGNAVRDIPYTGSLAGSAADVDSGASLAFSKLSGPAWLSVAPGGALSGAPAIGNVGVNTFTVGVSDGIAPPVSATFVINVLISNVAPVAQAQSVSTSEDAALAVTLTGSDGDNNPLTYAIVTQPANGTLSGTGPNRTYTPSANYNGSDSFTFRANDGTVDSPPATVSITITPGNDAPTWATNPITGTSAVEDAAYTGSIASSASDVDAGATLTFAKVSGPAWLSVGTDGTLSGTPANSNVGANSFTVSVSDGIAPVVQTTLNFTVLLSSLVWDTDAAGNWTDITNWLGDVAYASGATSTATFGNFITADRIITLNAPITIGNITASDTTHNYSISGANILTLDRSSGVPTINVTSGRTLTIGSEIAGLDGLQKSGLGTLTLTGANSYTGDTTITGGTLNLGGATANGSLASTVLNLANGTLSYTRTGTNTQNFTTTNIKSGASTASTTLTTNTLNLGDLTRDVGGTLNFGSTGSFITSEVNNASDIIGGWATYNNANWAVANGASAITGAPTYYTTTTGGITGANYTNVRNMDVSASVAMDATINPSTVRFNVVGVSTVTLAAGDNIIASGGILVTSTVGNDPSTITGGNLAGSSGGDLIIHQHNITGNSSTLTIGSIIKDNGTATGLTKSGAGTLSLTGNNSYTGVTAINVGQVTISNANALGIGAGNTTIASTGSTTTGGRLQFSTGSGNPITVAENITITGNSSGGYSAINNSGQSLVTLSGNITLSSLTGAIRFDTANSGSNMLFSGTIAQTGSSQTLILAANNAGGQNIAFNIPISLNGGTLQVSTSGAGHIILRGVNATDGTGIGQTVITGGGTLRLGVSGALNTTANLNVGNASATDTGTFSLLGFNQTVNALVSGTSAAVRIVQNSHASTASTLTVGNGGGSGTFLGTIVNGAAGTLALIKTGVGNQTLNDTNSYTGGTRIDGGILTLGHATNTLADAGAVNVNGGTLDLGTNTDTVGAVTLTSGSITGTGAGALTGSAYDVRSGTVSAKLGGLVGLTKTTVGTVTFSGDNAYTGATNVNDGKLLVNGNQSTASGSVTVAANATLGGMGTIGGNTTIAAGGKLEFNLSTIAASHDPLDIASGKSLAFSGASTLTITSTAGASPGIYTLITGGNNITGVAPATLNLPIGMAATVSISGNSLLLNVTSTGTTGPLDRFAISSIASTQTVGTPITGITITAQDASNATVTSFTGTVTFGGTGGFTGTSASFVSGVLTNVSVTPTVAGSNLTFTVDNGAGNTGLTTIATIQTQYQLWAIGGVAFDADTNGDGVKNGMAWLLGALNPSENALSRLPQASRNGTNLRLTFRCLKSTKRGGMVLKVQFSNDLGASDPWSSHDAPVPDADGTVGGVIFDTTDDGDYINVIADIPAAGARVFGRLVAIP